MQKPRQRKHRLASKHDRHPGHISKRPQINQDRIQPHVVSPSSCDQWHHLCDNGTSQGDIYLSMIVPKILSSTIFTTQRAALFIVYDEGTDVRQGAGTCPIGSGDCAYAVWAGPQVKNHYVCGENYSHYSFLSTIEWNWGLQNLTSNDGSAPPMSE